MVGGPLGAAIFGQGSIGGFLHLEKPHIQLAAEPIIVVAENHNPFLTFAITNTVITTWLTMAVLVVLALVATRNMRLAPRGLQNLFEVVLEYALNLVESIAGKENGRRFFPVVITIFIYVVLNNWLGLLPGFGTLGIFVAGEHGEREFFPFFRGANSDINTPLSLALLSAFFVEYWGISSLGLRTYGSKFINLRGGIIGFMVGIIEAISEFARIISFTFRLFGNIFAGEVLVIVGLFLLPLFFVTNNIISLMELFFGFIQAIIFAALTLVFATLAVTAHGPGGHEEAHH
ncbi:MAG: F0F1 ATP synthase subunit A [Chloroflexi bacterium]|nr:F0F1 ATP synthase subunit A [Chloroflexota bacterium]